MSITTWNEDAKQHLLITLKERFLQNTHRHPTVTWSEIESSILSNSTILPVLYQMEITEGEPDVLIFENQKLVYCDCSTESPKGRRSLCYDKIAWENRKDNKPIGNVIDMAQQIGITLLNESQYRAIQTIENFDIKTSSWLMTPESIRTKKGAIFGDKRYDHVFIYHNSAESYYAARGFRGFIYI